MSAVDANEQPIELADSRQDYLPVFLQDLPQNEISGRMEKNIRRLRNTVEDFQLIDLPSAGLRVYQPPGFHRSNRFTGFEFEREEKSELMKARRHKSRNRRKRSTGLNSVSSTTSVNPIRSR